MNDTLGERKLRWWEKAHALSRVQQTGIYESTSIQGDTRHYIGHKGPQGK